MWILWPLTFLPDADYLIVGLHRAVTGNVFITLPFFAVLGYAAYTRRRELAEWMGIALVYLTSHLVMDVFTGGSVLLWPFTDYNFCYYAGINVVTATNTLQPFFEVCSAPGVPTVSPVYPWLSVTEAAMLAFVLPAGLAIAAVNLRSYLRERRAPRAPSE